MAADRIQLKAQALGGFHKSAPPFSEYSLSRLSLGELLTLVPPDNPAEAAALYQAIAKAQEV